MFQMVIHIGDYWDVMRWQRYLTHSFNNHKVDDYDWLI